MAVSRENMTGKGLPQAEGRVFQQPNMCSCVPFSPYPARTLRVPDRRTLGVQSVGTVKDADEPRSKPSAPALGDLKSVPANTSNARRLGAFRQKVQ